MALHLLIKLWKNGLHLKKKKKDFMAGILVGTQNDCECVRHSGSHITLHTSLLARGRHRWARLGTAWPWALWLMPLVVSPLSMKETPTTAGWLSNTVPVTGTVSQTVLWALPPQPVIPGRSWALWASFPPQLSWEWLPAEGSWGWSPQPS